MVDSKELFACCVTPRWVIFQHPGFLYFAVEILSADFL